MFCMMYPKRGIWVENPNTVDKHFSLMLGVGVSQFSPGGMLRMLKINNISIVSTGFLLRSHITQIHGLFGLRTRPSGQ